MIRPNEDIRKEIRRRGLYTWQVAKAFGVSDTYFFNILRRDLNKETRAKIVAIISRLEKEQDVS